MIVKSVEYTFSGDMQKKPYCATVGIFWLGVGSKVVDTSPGALGGVMLLSASSHPDGSLDRSCSDGDNRFLTLPGSNGIILLIL